MSFQNLIAGSNPEIIPVVGMGATMIMYTDLHACTVVEVLDKDTIVVQEDNYTRTDKNGMSECQTYEFTPNPDATKIIVTRRKNGQWVQKGGSMKNGQKFTVGSRSRYHDFSF